METLSFPTVKLDELIGFFGDLQIPLTADDLTNPTAMRMIFESFAEHMLGATKTQKQPEFSALQHLSHPELHDEAIPEATVLSAIVKIGLASRIPDFSSKDLLFPEKKRSIHILSGLMNFAMFRDEIASVVEDLIKSTDKYNAENASLQDETRKLSEQLAKLEAKKRAEEPQVRALEEGNNQLAQEICRTNELQSKAIEQKAADKLKLQTLSDKITDLRFQKQAIQQQTAKLRDSLVPDPEALERSVKEKRLQLEQLKAAHANEEKREIELRSKEASVLRVEKEMNKAVKVLEDVQNGVERKTAAKTVLKEAQERLAECQNNIHNLQQEQQMVQKKLEFSREKQSKNSERMAAARKQAEVKTKEIFQKRTEADDLRVKTVALINENAADKQNIQQQYEAVVKKHQTEMNALASRFDELEDRLANYHNSVKRQISLAPRE